MTKRSEADKQRQLAALERIRLHREEIQRRNGNEPLRIDVVEMINQMREEQDARNLGKPRAHWIGEETT